MRGVDSDTLLFDSDIAKNWDNYSKSNPEAIGGEGLMADRGGRRKGLSLCTTNLNPTNHCSS